MTKWADYVITGVRFQDDKKYILSVEVRPDLGDKIGFTEDWKRLNVVDSIENGKTFVTAFRNGSEWRKGEDVHVVTINGTKYIRTDKNNTEKDNLGELPE